MHNDICIHSIPKPSLAMREGQLWGVRKTKDSSVYLLLLFCLFLQCLRGSVCVRMSVCMNAEMRDFSPDNTS